MTAHVKTCGVSRLRLHERSRSRSRFLRGGDDHLVGDMDVGRRGSEREARRRRARGAWRVGRGAGPLKNPPARTKAAPSREAARAAVERAAGEIAARKTWACCSARRAAALRPIASSSTSSTRRVGPSGSLRSSSTRCPTAALGELSIAMAANGPLLTVSAGARERPVRDRARPRVARAAAAASGRSAAATSSTAPTSTSRSSWSSRDQAARCVAQAASASSPRKAEPTRSRSRPRCQTDLTATLTARDEQGYWASVTLGATA